MGRLGVIPTDVNFTSPQGYESNAFPMSGLGDSLDTRQTNPASGLPLPRLIRHSTQTGERFMTTVGQYRLHSHKCHMDVDRWTKVCLYTAPIDSRGTKDGGDGFALFR